MANGTIEIGYNKSCVVQGNCPIILFRFCQEAKCQEKSVRGTRAILSQLMRRLGIHTVPCWGSYHRMRTLQSPEA